MSILRARAWQRMAIIAVLAIAAATGNIATRAADRPIQINLRPSDVLRQDAKKIMLPPEAQTAPRPGAAPQLPRQMTNKSQQRPPAARPSAIAIKPPPAPPPAGSSIDLEEKVEGPASLPRELTDADIDLYRRIFAVQASGDWSEADSATARLGNTVLIGYVQAQRLLHPEYTASYAALAAWLRRYHDLPDAPAVYRLALARRPRGAELPPGSTFVSRVPYSPAFALSRTVIGSDAPQAYILRVRLEQMLARGETADVETSLDEPATLGLLGSDEIAHWRGRLATRRAESGPALASARGLASGTARTRTEFVAGLAHWRRGEYANAARRFAAVADTPADQATSWTLSAGAFWAARAALRIGDGDRYTAFLKRAALHDRTFYGQIALHLLGSEPSVVWAKPAVDAAMTERLRGNEGTRRALALLQLGQATAAGRELFSAAVGSDPRSIESILALAVEARLAMASLQISSLSFDDRAEIDGFDAASFPLPPWHPDEGFVLDRALIFAFMRQESAFNVRARSSAGAMGLMQLMPGTAAFLVRGFLPHRTGSSIQDPGFNVSLGQQYLLHLLDDTDTDDLVRLAAAYNGGPGNVARWDAVRGNGNDPLLWIESIPIDETRDYVQRVLANYWIYANQLGQAVPSLAELAAGQWPRYVPQDRPHGTPSAVTRAARADARDATCLPRRGLQRPYMF